MCIIPVVIHTTGIIHICFIKNKMSMSADHYGHYIFKLNLVCECACSTSAG